MQEKLENAKYLQLFFSDTENRRVSAPAPVQRYAASNQEQAIINDQLRKRKRSSNINPFTPTSIMATLRKKARMTSGESATER